MFTQSFMRLFIPFIIMFVVAEGLFAAIAFGQGGAYQALPAVNLPAVEQTLVPEGVFAMQLAEALKLGPIPDAANAEALLSGLSIEPKNGWITEYPMTPAVLGEIEEGVLAASGQGRLALKKDQAQKLFADLKTRLGLDVHSGSPAPGSSAGKPGHTTVFSYTDDKGGVHFTDVLATVPQAFQHNVKTISRPAVQANSGGTVAKAPAPETAAKPNPDDIDDYYHDQGPPAVTYYAPPQPYNYLYSWVSYPFWTRGYYFPGYFMLNDFRRHVVFNRHPYFVGHHGSGDDQYPASSAGPVNQPLPIAAPANGTPRPRWFSSSAAQAGANGIVAHERHHHPVDATINAGTDASNPDMAFGGSGSRTWGDGSERMNSRSQRHNHSMQSAPPYDENTADRQRFGRQIYQPGPSRYFSAPVDNPDRDFTRSYSSDGNMSGGFNQSGGLHDGGSGGHGGRSFGGGRSGGRR